MGGHVSVAKRFWEDPYIQSLPPTDKLLFKYLIDGPQVESTLGIYEVSTTTMAFHTGLDKENIEHSLSRFAEAGKIHYIDGWVVVKNHFKNNPLNGNERLINGALKRFENIPWIVRDRVTDPTDTLFIPYLCPTDSLYIAAEHITSRHVTKTGREDKPGTAQAKTAPGARPPAAPVPPAQTPEEYWRGRT